ncbi:SsrA-binding protein [Candidatus Saganbacteria bacterium CG08_land_8_20_14_0_20_45_16]|uniref:SsrA-binding protein n=1 Tax=Candidatus Saganbacteria bacterium CG08_land_8_20_14_0_20_45_16 TaxID=2014293 RepID=A0A2H0XZ31_UNCSA|nr:MAG: SsrA-binding protein [Candidatus Saganbacteria bacterium CG08_land_8_20_14_0_20_45_16]
MAAQYYKKIADNRQARFDYNILDTYKAGLILKGSEVKSIRLGQVNLKDSFGRVEYAEVWIYGMHITPYSAADKTQNEPSRPRKALLKKRELVKLIGKVAEKGLTLVPLKIFFDGNWAKVELALAKAKKKYEKRDTLRQREAKREIERAFKGQADGNKK